jgi:hypothetical protein
VDRYYNPTCRTGPPGYIGWRNRFLGSINVYKYGLSIQYCAGIFKQSTPGARNRVGIGLSYRPARLHSQAELVPLEPIRGLLISLKIRALYSTIHNIISAAIAVQNFFLSAGDNSLFRRPGHEREHSCILAHATYLKVQLYVLFFSI